MMQAWQTRTWDELKAETQTRADRGAYPVFGITPEDAREALAMITSLDPDEWGSAWMTIGDRYRAGAGAAERRGGAAAAEAAHLVAGWGLAPRVWPGGGHTRKL